MEKGEAQEDVEDIFEDGLFSIFGDVKVSHGGPGEVFGYKFKERTLSLHIAKSETFEERVNLFAHFVWNSALLAADLITSCKFDVRGETVLELGAGAGLPGIVAALEGAQFTVLSDYESPTILANLKRNVDENIPLTLRNAVAVEGHIWGETVCSITRHCTSFSRIIAADCFWKSDAHCALVMSLDLLLQISPSARILVIAGLHTGRTVVCHFLKLAKTQGLVPDENGITEYDLLKGGTRPWEEDRGVEDTTEKKRWLIVTQLKRQ